MNKIVFVTVYADTTPFFTEEELDKDNICEIEIPEKLLHDYFVQILAPERCYDTYDEFMNKYTANDTDYLYDYCLHKGCDPKIAR